MEGFKNVPGTAITVFYPEVGVSSIQKKQMATTTGRNVDVIAVTGLFQPIGEQGGAALCGSVFKVEYTDCGQRREDQSQRKGHSARWGHLASSVEHLPALVRDVCRAGRQGNAPSHVDRALCGRLRDSRGKAGGCSLWAVALPTIWVGGLLRTASGLR